MKSRTETLVGYFDFETYNLTDFDFEKGDLKDWNKTDKIDKPIGVYGAGLLIDGIVYTWFGLKALDNFWSKLKEVAKGRKITLIAHNCAYDFACLNEFLHTNGYSKIKKFDAAQTDDERSWLWANIQVDGLDIKFLDTWIWDKNCSLAYYSEHLQTDIKKGELKHYEKWNLFEKEGRIYFYDKEGIKRELEYDLERRYLEDDVKLLPLVKEDIYKTKKLLLDCEFIPEEREWVHTFPEVNRKITKASFAKTCFELATKEYFYQGFKTPIDEADYYLQLKSYIGGFTAGNKNITSLDLDKAIIKSYDVNSLYPSIMAGSLPWGDTYFEPQKEWDSYCEWYEITGTTCEYKEKYSFLDCPIISVKFQEWLEGNKEYGLDCTFLILKDYYEIIQEYTNNDFKIVRVRYQQLSRKLARAINDAYALRVLVKNNNKPLADSIKLFLNSGYGKFGERTHEYVVKWNEAECCWEEEIAKKANFYTNLLTGLYVCTQGRIKLMKAIKTEIENGNTFLYSDTDSLKIVQNNPVKIYVDPDKLGAWKDEGSFNVWRYPLKRKRYYCYNTFTGDEKITCGGFSKWIVEDLKYEDKLKFFTPKTNIVVKNGKRVRFIGTIKNEKNKEIINRFGLTKLFTIDISTENDLKNPDYIIQENDEGIWEMSKA